MKRSVLGVLVDVVDYTSARDRIIEAAAARRPYSVSALAVHGVMIGVLVPEHRHRLNSLDLVTPDGQPVRWALNLLHRCGLDDRVYGPKLMGHLLAEAEKLALPVYFYGSNLTVVQRLAAILAGRHPRLKIVGAEASRFRALSERERDDLVARIRASGARLVFVGLGCPRQEVFVYELTRAWGSPHSRSVRPSITTPGSRPNRLSGYSAWASSGPPGWLRTQDVCGSATYCSIPCS